jgi:hypothetical protein
LKERRRGEQWSGVCERRKKGQRTELSVVTCL